MKIFQCVNNDSGRITNGWDDSNGLDASHYEPCFGEPGSYTIITTDIGNSQNWQTFRQKRNDALAKSDFALVADFPISSDFLIALKAWRQTLRDLPQANASISDPETIVIPEMPDLK